MTDQPLHYQSLTQLAAQIKAGTLSPVTLTEALLDRIDKFNGKLGTFKIITRERALAEAQAAELTIKAGQYLGPLHGIPYAAKDLYDVKGLPTGAGCSLLEDNIAEEDCEVVRRLAQTGMILLGKTHTVQFAFGGVGINHDTGTPHNPWQAEAHAPGGSSSGSGVAVAAGLAPMALGSDTGGSVRIPATLNGITGLKTTVGRISRAGVYALSQTLDSVGPLARTVADCALSYTAMQGADAVGDETTLGQQPHEVMRTLKAGVKDLRLCFAESVFWDEADPEVAQAVRETGKVFSALGAQVGSIPFEEAKAIAENKMRALVIAAEAYANNRPLMENHLDALDPVVAHRMAAGNTLSAPDYFGTIRIWRTLQQQANETLRDVDALLVPTSILPAKPIAEIDQDMSSYNHHNAAYLRNTAIGNQLALSAVTVPCGFTSKGLPIGLMIYSKAFCEEMALRVAYAFEQETEWHLRRPEMAWIG